MTGSGQRDRPGQNANVPLGGYFLAGSEAGTDGTPPYRGVPVSRSAMSLGIASDIGDLILFEERAAIREYDGGLPRDAAERLAALDVLADRRDRQVAAA
jgi:hypothetical protein